jgi:hypothetical protein
MQALIKVKPYFTSAANITAQTLRSQIGSKGKLVGIQAVAPAGGGNAAYCIISLYNAILDIPLVAVSQTTNDAHRTYWLGKDSVLVPSTGLSLAAGAYATEGIYGSLPFACPNQFYDVTNNVMYDLRITVTCTATGTVNLFYIEDDENAIGHV